MDSVGRTHLRPVAYWPVRWTEDISVAGQASLWFQQMLAFLSRQRLFIEARSLNAQDGSLLLSGGTTSGWTFLPFSCPPSVDRGKSRTENKERTCTSRPISGNVIFGLTSPISLYQHRPWMCWLRDTGNCSLKSSFSHALIKSKDDHQQAQGKPWEGTQKQCWNIIVPGKTSFFYFSKVGIALFPIPIRLTCGKQRKVMPALQLAKYSHVYLHNRHPWFIILPILQMGN